MINNVDVSCWLDVSADGPASVDNEWQSQLLTSQAETNHCGLSSYLTELPLPPLATQKEWKALWYSLLSPHHIPDVQVVHGVLQARGGAGVGGQPGHLPRPDCPAGRLSGRHARRPPSLPGLPGPPPPPPSPPGGVSLLSVASLQVSLESKYFPEATEILLGRNVRPHLTTPWSAKYSARAKSLPDHAGPSLCGTASYH